MALVEIIDETGLCGLPCQQLVGQRARGWTVDPEEGRQEPEVRASVRRSEGDHWHVQMPPDHLGDGTDWHALVPDRVQRRSRWGRFQRQAIIAAHAELRERELIKLASLGSALASALRQRGVPDPAASLAAEAGIAVFKVAFERWIDEMREPNLARLIRESLEELKTVTAGT